MVNIKDIIFGGLLPVFKTEMWYVNPETYELEFKPNKVLELPAVFVDFLELNFELCSVSGVVWFGMYIYCEIEFENE